MNDQLQQLVATLRANKLDPTSEEVAEVIWLANHMSMWFQEQTALESSSDAPSIDSEDETQAKQDDKHSVSHAWEEPADSRSTSHDIKMYPHSSADNSPTQNGKSGFAFQSPGAAALPGAQEIGRKLRPLMRRVPSRTSLEFDVDATIERIADQGIWAPQLRPTATRWLEVALVIDESSSMVIWQRTIAEFRRLIERHGAFRDVRTWGLVTDAAHGELELRAGIGPLARSYLTHNPRELIDPAGRRIFIIVSDCLAPAWYRSNGKVNALLKTWAYSGPIALVQVLPMRLWIRTALCEAPETQLNTLAAGVPNIRLITNTATRLLGSPMNEDDFLKLPVLTLDPNSVAEWAKLVAGVSGVNANGRLLPVGLDTEVASLRAVPRPSMPDYELSVEQHVNRFMSAASDEAITLAQLLSCFPLRLPVMRLVQQTLLPNSLQTHLAEVFLGGLLETRTPNPDQRDPDLVEYEFLPGVRAHLRAQVPASRQLAALRSISRRIAGEPGQSDFMAILENPGANGHQAIQADSLPFAEYAAEAFSHFGPTWAALADHFKRGQGSKDSLKKGSIPSDKLIGESISVENTQYFKQPTIPLLKVALEKSLAVLNVSVSIPGQDELIKVNNNNDSFSNTFISWLEIDLGSLPINYDTLGQWMQPAILTLLSKNSLAINITPSESVMRIGDILFKSLFSTTFLGEYHLKDEQRKSQPLQLRLSVPAKLSSVPWELLWDGENWLARDQGRTFARLPQPTPETKSAFLNNTYELHKRKNPLHILVVASSYTLDDTEESINHLKQLRRCFESVHGERILQVEYIDGPDTYQKLLARLEDSKPIHLLHIFAHGEMPRDDYALLLTGSKAAASSSSRAKSKKGAFEGAGLRGSDLRDALRKRHAAHPNQLHLVVLNADFSAREPQNSRLRSLAAGIVLDGVPAVVGVQGMLKPEVLTSAMPEFYEALLDAEPIDVAINRARAHVYDYSEPTLDWASLLLFVHPSAVDLRLFEQRVLRNEQQIEITGGEFLEAQGVGRNPSNEIFFVRKSEGLASNLYEIFVHGPLRQLPNHLINAPIGTLMLNIKDTAQYPDLYKQLFETSSAVKSYKPLNELKSFFFFAQSGHGKTSYQLRMAQDLTKNVLIVHINYNEYSDALRKPHQEYAQTHFDILKRNIYKNLKDHNERDRLEQWPFFQQLRSEIDYPNKNKQMIHVSFDDWMKDLENFIRDADLQGVHLVTDNFDIVESEQITIQILEPLIYMILRLKIISTIAFKFFLPDTLLPTVWKILNTHQSDIRMYWLDQWTSDQLENMLNRRLEVFSRGSITSFQQLCAKDCSKNIGQRLCQAANGSPQQLIELVHGLISEHCRHIDDPETRIPQRLIDDFLAREYNKQT